MHNRIRKWPGYVPPENDELLSSWLIRLIRSHYCRPFTFSAEYFNGYSLLARDIDKYLPEEILELISEYSYLNIEDVKNLQLCFYKNIVYEDNIETNFIQGITNLGIYHRTKKHNGLLICPGCIRKNTYFKKSWRLLSSIICTECKTYLIDSCPDCKSPIDFQRRSIGRNSDYLNNPFHLCWNCDFDFRDINLPAINKLHIKYQLYIDKTIQKGYNNHTHYSFLYFNVLFVIFQKFRTTSGTWSRVHNAFVSEFQIDNKIIKDLNYKSYQLSPLTLRIEILPLIFFLLEDWPYRFLKFIKKHKIRYTDFSKDISQNDPLPFWFQSVFNNL